MVEIDPDSREYFECNPGANVAVSINSTQDFHFMNIETNVDTMIT